MKINQNSLTGLYSRRTGGVTAAEDEKQIQSGSQSDTAAARTDSVAISSQGIRFISGDGRITVSSGSDILEAEMKSDKTVSVYFSDSAMVSRAVKRGYIEINGNKTALSDEVKKELIRTDKQAQKARESAFAYYNTRHNMAVAQQQSNAVNKQINSDIQAFSTAAKMSRGSQVSHEEESQLLKSDPEMYFMSKMAQQMSKYKDKDYGKVDKDEPSQPERNNTGKSFTTYRTKMDVDISSGTVDTSSIDLDEKEVSV
ncbi:MAG: hypothetical protein ACI4JB_07840 [Porcipelethomonas sp.]